MALPINIKEILNGHTVEWDRIECKAGWNPEDILHAICAFANDINNWGGGYIFVGIEEDSGVPKLPPKGLALNALDKIQKELLNLCHHLQPVYTPVSQPSVIEGKNILTIWVPGGDNRPYKAPTTLGEKGQKRYYIRRGSTTVLANQQEEQLLLEIAKRVPFDDQVNHQASINDLDFGLIRDFLEEVNSDLRVEATRMSLADVAIQMRIASGPPEGLLPLNVGLLFFSRKPELFFRGAVTEVVIYEDSTGKEFVEKRFAGPLHLQIRNVLSFIETNYIEEKVIKSPVRAEAKRVFNFPFAAIEEIVANAFYHRSYELENPIEINIWPDKMEILSFPGPLPPVTRAMLKQRRIVARNYRNRRVGDFFKELKLTEGRATGFPTIYDSMEENGSAKPDFETDDDFGYFLATLPVHTLFLIEERQSVGHELQILLFCMQPKKRGEILSEIGLTNHPKNYTKYVLPLIDKGWLAYTEPDKPTSPNQRYKTTAFGMGILES